MIALPLLLSIYIPPVQCQAVDGDTLRCEDQRVRLLGIDAPEIGNHCRRGRVCVKGDAEASKRALAAMIRPGVTISPVTRDRYGRTVAVVYAGDKNLSCAMIEQGLAVYIAKWDNGRRIARDCPQWTTKSKPNWPN